MNDQTHILITGANGLLGNRIVKQLSERYKVSALVRSIPEDQVKNVQYLKINFSESWDVADLPDDVDTIFHLVQSSKFRDFPDEAMDVFKVNVESTAKLLDFAHKSGVKRFVYASSGGIYGSGTQAFDEDSPITPSGRLGYYLGSKLCGEVLAQNYAQLMTVVTLRFFFMYGPEQDPSMLIPRLIDSVSEGRPITLQGEDGIHINPVHVADATHALESTLKLEESCALNIAGPEVLSLRKIAEIIGKAVGKEPAIEMQDAPANHIVASIEGMASKLVAPKISFEEGVLDFI